MKAQLILENGMIFEVRPSDTLKKQSEKSYLTQG